MLKQNLPQAHSPLELPAITDWKDFATWCHQEGRQALPATDDTLMRYAAAKVQRDRTAIRRSNRLGWFALIMAAAAILLPILVFVGLSAVSADPRLSEMGALLLFGGLQLIALSAAWTSRESIEGRAAWRMACLASTTVLLVTYVVRDTTTVQAIKSLVRN